MFFRQLLAKDATLSYFFGCGSCHVGVAVDPVLGDEQWFIDEAAKQDVKITHVIDTHVHADHYTGGRKLAELTGAAYCLHEVQPQPRELSVRGAEGRPAHRGRQRLRRRAAHPRPHARIRSACW